MTIRCLRGTQAKTFGYWANKARGADPAPTWAALLAAGFHPMNLAPLRPGDVTGEPIAHPRLFSGFQHDFGFVHWLTLGLTSPLAYSSHVAVEQLMGLVVQ